MYSTFRQMQADLGRMDDAVGFASYIVDRLNSDHGGNARAAINIGGDPSAVVISNRFETLGGYATMRESMAADAGLQAAIRLGADLFTSATDAIVQVIKPPGDPAPITVVNMANMNMARVGDAIALALEVAEFTESVTGLASGVATAVTGDRSQLMWFGFGDNLDQVGENGQKLETNEEYLGFFKRSADLFVPGSLNQSIWQNVA